MRIALTADPELPVPPKLYGGIERVVAMLANELVSRGHHVTLFAHPESRTDADLVPWPGRRSQSRIDSLRNARTLWRESQKRRVDVIHSFSRIAYLLPLLPLSIPKLMSYQRPISSQSVKFGHALSMGTLEFSAISEWMMRPVAGLGRWHLVPNGVQLSTYPFAENPGLDAPLVFLGRVEKIKGPHLAIEIARRTGLRLVIAGNVPIEHQDWFDREIAPHINQQITYIGPVDDQAKAALLGSARALLMPILWDEPFGIVMAESMACGTPVIGLRRGSVPEVVEHGITGFVADTLDELTSYIPQINLLDRLKCRQRVENNYTEKSVVDGYLDVYRQLLCRKSA